MSCVGTVPRNLPSESEYLPPNVTVTRPAEPEQKADEVDSDEEQRCPNHCDEEIERVLSQCGEPDSTLAGYANYLGRRIFEPNTETPTTEDLKAELRNHGMTSPWPKWLILEAQKIDTNELGSRIQAWVKKAGNESKSLCGISVRKTQAGLAVIVLAAEENPRVVVNPAKPFIGSWVTVETNIGAVNVSQVVVMGPKGAPRTVPFWREREKLKVRFSTDQPGQWTLSVVGAKGRESVRPVVEKVFSVRTSPTATDIAKSNNENERYSAEPQTNGQSDEEYLWSQLQKSREESGVKKLAWSDKAALIANAHAKQMSEAGRLAHDIGNGDPEQRVEQSGVFAKEVGENIAHSTNAMRAHRAVWTSVAHRHNLLSPQYTHGAIGVANGKDGSRWVVELFLTE